MMIEDTGPIFLFLPKFHCEVNTIEMYWFFIKYCNYLSTLLLAILETFKAINCLLNNLGFCEASITSKNFKE